MRLFEREKGLVTWHIREGEQSGSFSSCIVCNPFTIIYAAL